jgi:sodium-coupled monocarboxylate transporter 8/12
VTRPLDLAVFVAYMALLTGVGFAFARRKSGANEYLLAGQDVHWAVVAVSVLAALFSGISYLGAPAEAFFHDLTNLWAVSTFLIATPLVTVLFLPFFRSAGVVTAYEYLDRRFDARLRRLGSGLFVLRVTFYLGLAISAPAMVVAEMTGWPFAACALLAGGLSTAFATLGGMKAVVWTDSVQFLVLCGGVLLIIAAAACGVPGGLPEALRLAAADGKTNFVRLDPDPRVRLTVWGCLAGGLANNLVQMVTDQIAVQRYLTARSLAEARRALWFKLSVTLPLLFCFYLCGTVLYGFYKAHPARVPPLAGAALVPGLNPPPPSAGAPPLANDRILPYFVTYELPSPLPGLLVAAIVGATVAVVSAGVHALATAALVDLAPGDPARLVGRARVAAFGFGVVSTGLALVVAVFGTMIEATNRIIGLFGGPLLGLFLLGVVSRRATAGGATAGLACGAAAAALVGFSGSLFGVPISFMWITPVSAAVTVAVGHSVSPRRRPPPPEKLEAEKSST